MARAGDDVAFGLENRCLPAEAIWPRVDAALQAVGFGYGRDRPTDALSGGEQQRLAIAGVLALRPGLLLLDEPTANLDPDGAAAIREVVASVVERLGLTLVMVEHRVADALPLVDRVVAIEAGGGVMADGRPYDGLRPTRGRAGRGGGLGARSAPSCPATRHRPEPETLLLAEQVAFRYPGSVLSALVAHRPAGAGGGGGGHHRAERQRQVHAGDAAGRVAAADLRDRGGRRGAGARAAATSRSGAGRPRSWSATWAPSSRTPSTSS